MVALYFARRCFLDALVLFEMTGPILIISVGTLALALAGVIVQIG